ncbi:cation:proton antiporter [Enterobacter cloacae subsp. cloacae]|nr:cation:proton antiporter [Enterobacter cloacae subsp. cloacae]
MTVVGIGFLISLGGSRDPVNPRFALAAVLSPADAVALSGIVGEGRIRRKSWASYREALMNDASGLVALVLGRRNGDDDLYRWWRDHEFFKVAIGGILAGFVVSWLYGCRCCFLSRWGGDEPATQIVLCSCCRLLLSDCRTHWRVGHSGSFVAAGMTITRSGVMRRAPWLCVCVQTALGNAEFVFNGMVFLLFGSAAAGHYGILSGGGGGRSER